MKTLNIIGAGNLGKTLGYLFYHNNIYLPKCILNRQYENAGEAVKFIGSGQAIAQINELKPADITLISTSDDKIADIAKTLSELNLLADHSIVFHCSGAQSSALLRTHLSSSVAVASVHPILSFPHPFTDHLNCYCSMEGDTTAMGELEESFKRIGSKIVRIKPEQKLEYHAALVMVSNHLIGLVSTALEQLKALDISQATALAMVKPLVETCMSHLFTQGPYHALTGPISRGDSRLVKNQLDQLKKNDPRQSELYRLLGRACLQLLIDHDDNSVNIEEMLQILSD